MKKFRSIALLVLAITVLLLSLASCEIFGGNENPPEDNHVHSFSDATCTAPMICECGTTDGKALGHLLVHDGTYTPPTCTEDGSHGGMHCERCDFTVAPSTLPAKGHSYSEKVTAPTCTEEGYTTYKCSCGDSYVVTTEAKGHSYVSDVIAPTCTEDGYTTYTCSCGDSYVVTAEATGHTFESDVCTVCGEKNDPKKVYYDFMPLITEQMPAIYINTPNGSNAWATSYNRNDKLAGRIDYVDATVSTGNCEDDYILSNLAAEVKVRGNYTLEYPKKPIRIKFNKKQNMLGLHDGEKYKNWVLLADWKDLSMTNNTVAFYLGNTLLASDGYYCTDFRNVEVYLNGQYWGVYLLVEQQEVKDNRTSVPEVEDDYTGNDIGYFFEYDGYYNLEGPDGDPTFTMTYPSGANYRSGIGYTIKSDINADSQVEFLRNYMNNAYYIAFQATKGNFYKFDENYNVVPDTEATSAKEVASRVIDIQSLVDIYILNEIACDLDVDWSSSYLSLNMTAEGNKKVTFEAPWDWDSCFGLRAGIVDNAQGLYACEKGNPWFNLFKSQDWYWEMVYEKWEEMMSYNLLEKTINLINLEKETYKEYYIKNYERWSQRVSQGNSECNATLNSYKDVNTAQGLAADYLISWLTKRFAYLDSVWGNIVPEEPLPENGVTYRYEAEAATLGGFSSSTPIRTDRDYASNNSYVGDVREGSTITFTVNSAEATTARLYLGISKLGSGADINSWFSVSVNGVTIVIPPRQVPAISSGEQDYHTFISIDLTNISLNAGDNVIVVKAVTNTTNVDYIEIYSASTLK